MSDPGNHELPERAEVMLELRDLVKHYPIVGSEPVRAVDGVSLTVRSGEMVALYGPSGSGKTTLLLMIATLLAPTSGAVLIGGRDTSSLSEREASHFRLTELGFIRQNFDLLPGASTIDNAILKLLSAMRWRQAQREIEPLLVRLGLGERLRHRSETLSMGERQRVMIARALSTNPRLLLADEPTGSLDTQRGREVLELLRELCREHGVAVVLVSHDPIAGRYADRVLALRDGRLGDHEADDEANGKFEGSPGASALARAGVSPAVGGAGGTPHERCRVVKAFNILRLYRVRLRARAAQECLAILGIAAGVALLFASQVSSSSLEGSVSELDHGIVGNATLQLSARDPHGLEQSMVKRVRRLAGVRAAAPLLEASAQASGPRGEESVQLVGADGSLPALGGRLVPHGELSPFGGIGAVVIAAPLSRALGVTSFGQEVTLRLAGHTVQAPLYAQLGERQIGQLARSPVVIAPLSYLQEMAGLQGRVSRILVATAPGAQTRVRTELAVLAEDRLNVESSTYEGTLFANAATASSQSSALFSAISALVGFLFAFNATLLTAPARRRLIADLRHDGYTPRTVIAVLCLDALVLGVLACALGLALGEVLSTRLLLSDPSFFSLAFTVGSEQSIDFQDVAIAAGGGMLAAFAAVLSPLREVRSRTPLAAVKTHERSDDARARARMGLTGLACLVAASALLAVEPDAAIPGMVLVIAALLCILPLVLAATLALTGRLARLFVSPVPHIARLELSAGQARTMAIAATGAMAVFGSVAIQGARRDLLAGLRTAARETSATAQIWVAPTGSYNLLVTTPFAPLAQARLRSAPGVKAVGLYRGGLLDYGLRRVLVMAPPFTASTLLPRGQLSGAEVLTAERRVRGGGWLVMSKGIAEEHNLRVGQAVTLPTPNPTSMRIAALSTNIGWEPGSILMSSPSYAHAWGSTDASAYAIQLAPGVTPSHGARELRQALADSGQTALAVQTAEQRSAGQEALDERALARLTQIATLIPIFAVLAMAAAIGAMVWQRRPRLAKLKLEGLARAQLWRTILLESLLLLGAGCMTGTVFGLYAQRLADRALVRTINFPLAHSLNLPPALANLGLVMATALALLALPGYLATGVPASVALQE